MSTFYAPGDWSGEVELGEGAAHHATVKRLAVGEIIGLANGAGQLADASIVQLGKRSLRVAVVAGSQHAMAPLPDVELWAPVGDRDRMLWLAEKATELGVSSWRPVMYQRSRSVTPRGEGEAFRAKVEARMIGALEQSGGAWLPRRRVECAFEAIVHETPTGALCVLLHTAGEPIVQALTPNADGPLVATRVVIALGPEGGLNEAEVDAFASRGWRTVSLGPNILRFETAALAALAVVRTLTLPRT